MENRKSTQNRTTCLQNPVNHGLCVTPVTLAREEGSRTSRKLSA